MTTPTASEVNRRIARWLYPQVHDRESYLWVRFGDKEKWTLCPDFTRDIEEAIAALEKYCREHNKVADLFFNGKVWVSQIGDNFFCAPDQRAEADEQIATAASLALYAVLGEGS